jgi:hypothetical protein
MDWRLIGVFGVISALVFVGCGCGCGGGNPQSVDNAPVESRSDESAIEPNDESSTTDEKEADGQCVSDADCVRGECCHPRTCVLASQAPDCKETVCTMDCVPQTMDCGARVCQCQNGQCTVSWSDEQR